MNLLWLSEEDVTGLLSVHEALPLVEEAFAAHARGQVQMPPKVYLLFKEFNGDLRSMPAYMARVHGAGGRPFAGVKVVNSHPDNPKQGLPTVAAVFVLNDPKTGLPLALMAAGRLTNVRTGAAGGVAAKFLARADSRTVGFVGCGRQAVTQWEALKPLFNIETVKVAGQNLAEAKGFVQAMGDSRMRPTDVQEACRADIVVTTTPGRAVAVRAGWIAPGTHINAIGADAPGKQELDVRLLQKARIFVDSKDQAEHSGEINVAISKGKLRASAVAGNLGEVIIGKKKGRKSAHDITVFDSTGLAVQDLVSAAYVYTRAIALKKGTTLSF